ncbi:MAG: glycosyltransferase family 2 protein [Solirubrobacteraceae bacterium]
MPAEDPEVSVVVPVLNAAATIASALRALAEQSDARYEVIVVDGGSTDGSLELLAAAEAGAGSMFSLLHNPLGDPASSRNLGARHARGQVLAFTDADCEPDAGWLAAGLSALGRGAELVQGRVVPASSPGPFDRTVSVGAEHGLYETANLFLTRDAFERAGGFEPLPGLRLAPGTHFGEDAWFAWRAKRAGARSTFAADAVVKHAVFERDAAAFIAERRRAAYFPALVAAIPELRSTFLHRRLFLSQASARFDLALAGAVLALVTRRAPAALLAAPWLAGLARAPSGTRGALAAADALTAAALLAGSVRHATPVL